MPPRPLFVANWKMNGLHADGLARASALAGHAAGGDCGGDIVVCPPATLLFALRAVFAGSQIELGGQDCHATPAGAHTGDVSAPMLADAGCAYVIVGHSERRAGHGEADETVAGKADAAHAAGLAAIVCVGESAVDRNDGRALAVIGRQVERSLPDGSTTDNTAIAYEPVWAIGTGRTPAPADIEAAHAEVRAGWERRFSGSGAALRVLYGGSVTARNAGEIMAALGVDGVLVGGAGLSADTFWQICQACR
ncbi:MAG: triose-phosphate isomerase [Rhodospirillales bacterium]|nr:triose-phosphate isomerase [Rhodospirillales bacterium]